MSEYKSFNEHCKQVWATTTWFKFYPSADLPDWYVHTTETSTDHLIRVLLNNFLTHKSRISKIRHQTSFICRNINR